MENQRLFKTATGAERTRQRWNINNQYSSACCSQPLTRGRTPMSAPPPLPSMPKQRVQPHFLSVNLQYISEGSDLFRGTDLLLPTQQGFRRGTGVWPTFLTSHPLPPSFPSLPSRLPTLPFNFSRSASRGLDHARHAKEFRRLILLLFSCSSGERGANFRSPCVPVTS